MDWTGRQELRNLPRVVIIVHPPSTDKIFMSETQETANFSDNVANAHGPNWLQWIGHLAGKPAVGLELGVWKGQFSEWLLDNILTAPTSVLWCVDTFEGSDEHRLAGIDCSALEREARQRLERFGRKAQVFRSRSDHALSGFLKDDEFDFIYVDAAHDSMNVLRDAVLAFDLLKVGGVMVFDDYEWTSMEQEIDRPKLAIDSFIQCYARRIEILGVGWQVAVRKVV